MGHRRLILVHENPELGLSLQDLLRAAGYLIVDAFGWEEVEAGLREVSEDPTPFVVVASNHFYSPTVRRWRAGRLGPARLVLVGCRDPELRAGGGLEIIPLPLNVPGLLRRVALHFGGSADPAGAAQVDLTKD